MKSKRKLNDLAKQCMVRTFEDINGSDEEGAVWDKMIPFVDQELRAPSAVVGMVLLKMAAQTMTKLRLSLEEQTPEAPVHPEQMKQILSQMLHRYIDICEFICNEDCKVAGSG